LLGTVYLNFITLDSNNNIQVVRGSVWLVRTVDSKAYLREYNVVALGFAYISKLNALNQITSLQ